MKPKSLLLHPRYDFVVTHFTYVPVASIIIVGGLLHGRHVHSGDARERVKTEPPDPSLIGREAMPRLRNVLWCPWHGKDGIPRFDRGHFRRDGLSLLAHWQFQRIG